MWGPRLDVGACPSRPAQEGDLGAPPVGRRACRGQRLNPRPQPPRADSLRRLTSASSRPAPPDPRLTAAAAPGVPGRLGRVRVPRGPQLGAPGGLRPGHH